MNKELRKIANELGGLAVDSPIDDITRQEMLMLAERLRDMARNVHSRSVSMPEDELLALAQRAVACHYWCWMPGMCVRHERLGTLTRVSRRLQRDSFWLQEGWLPDLTDPATLGCLMALVREAWEDPYFYVVRGDVKIKGTDIFGWDFFGDFRGRSCKGMLYRSEAEALVAALEAAL